MKVLLAVALVGLLGSLSVARPFDLCIYYLSTLVLSAC